MAFRPLPFLGNAHVQTLLGHFLPGAGRLPGMVREVPLPDGDRLAIHDSKPPPWKPRDSVVVLVHGLGGSHQSGYMVRLGTRLYARGIRIVRMDLRGVGAGERLARRTYHGGCSEDLRAVLQFLHRENPESALVLLGLSLGGNIVLKLAGEASQRLVPGLHAVAAVAPPIDLLRCAELLARPGNRLYENYFTRQLVHQVRRHQRNFPGMTRTRFPLDLTMRKFDDLYTAPHWGFQDAQDYYRRASALPWMEGIAIPAFLLAARDDPFIAVEPFEALSAAPNRDVVIVDRGGHLGFLGRDGAGGIRWGEQRVLEWILDVALNRGGGNNNAHAGTYREHT